jgi:hypothetical protein
MELGSKSSGTKTYPTMQGSPLFVLAMISEKGRGGGRVWKDLVGESLEL